MAVGDWYLGPAGDLRALPVPEPGMTINQVRYGGTHQGLSGARVQDTTGRRQEYTFDFKYLDKNEYFWLESLASGHVPGPFRLIDPLKKNRFNNRSTTMPRVAGMANILSYSPDYPDIVDIPGRAYNLHGWSGSSLELDWESRYNTPVFPNETITASVFMKCGSTHQGSIRLAMLDFDMDVIDVQSVTASITTSWQRFTITRTVPADCVAVQFRTVFGSANTTVAMAAGQLEAGNAATSWEPGGGAPVVIIDQLTTTSPLIGYRDCNLVLQEV